MKSKNNTINSEFVLKNKNMYKQYNELFKRIIKFTNKRTRDLSSSKFDREAAKAIRDLATVAIKLMEGIIDPESDIIKMKDGIEYCLAVLDNDKDFDKDWKELDEEWNKN